MNTVSVKLFSPGIIHQQQLTYVVMAARYQEEWIFVRHRDRSTWEVPAGHIEPGESADQAAVRELYEEAGVVRSHLVHCCDYSVSAKGKTEHGRLYGATVEELDSTLEHEIEEIMLSDRLPQSLTYPEVQTILFKRAKEHFQL